MIVHDQAADVLRLRRYNLQRGPDGHPNELILPAEPGDLARPTPEAFIRGFKRGRK